MEKTSINNENELAPKAPLLLSQEQGVRIAQEVSAKYPDATRLRTFLSAGGFIETTSLLSDSF